MKKLFPHRDLLLISLFALLAFFGSLVLLRVTGIHVSPDENANAFFAQQFSQTGRLAVFEPLNIAFNDALHPRSTVSVNGWLVPGGFIGLPVLYGIIISFFGGWILTFITPLLAIVALFAWYGLVKKIYDREIAALSSLLLAIMPAWWYYSARSLMPNVPFVAFLIFAGYFLITRPSKNKRYSEMDFVISGLLTGLALFIRPSELIWLALASVVAAVWFRTKCSIRPILLFLGSIVIALIPMLFLNQATYSSPFTTGYTVEADPSTRSARGGDIILSPELACGELCESVEVSGTESSSEIRQLLFPFGLSRTSTITNALSYGLGMFWWIAILGLIGLPLLFPTRQIESSKRNEQKAYLTFAAIASVYLIILYGSWTFYDNPDQSQVTMANSHVRYWLPIFVLATPAVAAAIRWISRRAFTPTARFLSTSALIIICLGLSVRTTFFLTDDGLVNVADTLAESHEIHEHLLNLTEPDAVVIVDRADKLFFPDRRVLYPLREESTYILMPRIVLRAPLYYYGITLPEKDLTWLNTEKLFGLGLRIELVETFGIETLYRIQKK